MTIIISDRVIHLCSLVRPPPMVWVDFNWPFWLILSTLLTFYKWPLLQPTIQSRRSEDPLASVYCQNSWRVRRVWVTSLCSVTLVWLPLYPSSIRILSEDSYLYFSAIIYYYCFDLQLRNYCCAIFNILCERKNYLFHLCIVLFC